MTKQNGFAEPLEKTEQEHNEQPEKAEKRPYVVSDKVLAANRANAAHTTGPRTSAGKAIVSLNAVKHGLLARQTIINRGDGAESLEEFENLVAAFLEDLHPETNLERALVERIVNALWRSRRALRYEIGCIRHNLDRCNADIEPDPDDPLSTPAITARLDDARATLARLQARAKRIATPPTLTERDSLRALRPLLNRVAKAAGGIPYRDPQDWPRENSDNRDEDDNDEETPIPLDPPYRINAGATNDPHDLPEDKLDDWLFKENYVRWCETLTDTGLDLSELPRLVLEENQKLIAKTQRDIERLERALADAERYEALAHERRVLLAQLPSPDIVARLARYETRLDNEFFRSLAHLRHEQDRRAARLRAHLIETDVQPSSDQTTRSQPAHEPADEEASAESQTHEQT